jgi:hypothetical protein
MKPTKELERILSRAVGKLEYSKGKEVGVAYMIDSINLPGQISIYNWVADHKSVYELCGSVCNYLLGSPPACPEGHLFGPCVEVLKKQGYTVKIVVAPYLQTSEPGRIH